MRRSELRRRSVLSESRLSAIGAKSGPAKIAHFRTLLSLYERADIGHSIGMTGPAEKSKAAALGRVFWPLLTIALAAGIGWKIYAGVAYHKTGGPSDRAIHSGLFWCEIVFQIVVTLLCAGAAVRVLRTPKA